MDLAELGGAARPARRDDPEPVRRGDGPARPGLRPRRPRGRLRRQGPHPARIYTQARLLLKSIAHSSNLSHCI